MHGRAELGFVHADGVSRLARLYQRSPLRVLFPDPARDEPPQAALVTTSGGLAGGDRLELAVQLGPQARAVVVASAAEKVYRSDGADTVVEVGLDARSGAWLEVLPQETILFDGARLRRRTRIEAAADAGLMAGEILIFGRTARAERMRGGLVRDAWEIRRDGRLIWADALHLEGDIIRHLDAPAGFGGAAAAATLVLLCEDTAGACAAVRDWLGDYPGRAGATVVNGVLVARWLDEDARRLRTSFGRVWAGLRHAAAGLPESLPRLWDI